MRCTNLEDFYLNLPISELTSDEDETRWILGLGNFLSDIEFMLKRQLSIFWRVCWSIVTPGIILIIFFYTIGDLKPLKYNDTFYPDSAYGESSKLDKIVIRQTLNIYGNLARNNINFFIIDCDNIFFTSILLFIFY